MYDCCVRNNREMFGGGGHAATVHGSADARVSLRDGSALLGTLLLATLSATAVGAASFAVTVDHTADDNNACATSGAAPCSLRDAIAYANTKTSMDTTTITLPASFVSYALTQG